MSTSFTPPALSSHEGPAKFTPPPLSAHEGPAPQKQGFVSAFWEGIGGKALMDIMGGASRDPALVQKSMDTLKGLASGLTNEGPRIMKELDSAGEAIRKGDWGLAAHHAAGAAPLFGAAVQNAGAEWERGDKSAAAGHTAALFAPFLGDVPVPPGVSDAVDAAATAAGGAVKNAAKAAVTPTSLVRASPIEAVTAALGSYLGKELGLPGHVAGALAGRMAPQIIKAGYRGGKAALAERALAKDAASIPPDVMAELTRESGIPEPPVPQEAPVEAPQATIPEARRLEAGPRVTPMEAPPDASYVKAVPGEYPQVEQQPTIAERIQEQFGAKPAMIGAHKAAGVQPNGGGNPLRPPLKAAGVEPNAVAPQEPIQAPEPTGPAIDPKPSEFHANGERKSPEFLVQEKIARSTTGKAQRWADALEKEGITPDLAGKIQGGRVSDSQIQAGMPPRWENVLDDLVRRGHLPEGETVPQSSVPEIIAELRKREAAKAPATKPTEVSSQPAKSPRDMTRAELAKQAGLPENATTQQIMKALAKAMEEDKPKAATGPPANKEGRQ